MIVFLFMSRFVVNLQDNHERLMKDAFHLNQDHEPQELHIAVESVKVFTIFARRGVMLENILFMLI